VSLLKSVSYLDLLFALLRFITAFIMPHANGIRASFQKVLGLQRFALKPELRINLKSWLRHDFKFILSEAPLR